MFIAYHERGQTEKEETDSREEVTTTSLRDMGRRQTIRSRMACERTTTHRHMARRFAGKTNSNSDLPDGTSQLIYPAMDTEVAKSPSQRAHNPVRSGGGGRERDVWSVCVPYPVGRWL